MQHGRRAAQGRGVERRHRRVAAEADHRVGIEPADHQPCLERAVAERAKGFGKRHRIAPTHRRARDHMHAFGGEVVMRGAAIGGERDGDAAFTERDGERLRRKQMPARATRREEHQRLAPLRAHL